MRLKVVSSFLLMSFVTGAAFAKSSFNEIKNKMYATPSAELPKHMGLSKWDVISNLIGSESFPSHGLTFRSRRTLVDKSDERPPEPKWLHPRGACAQARWVIDTESGSTGLFAKDVDVPAIIRISSGDAVSEYSEESKAGGRIFGMALKLYPTDSEDHRVESRNILTLDQYGFDRTTRKNVFWEDDQTPVYFTNVAPAKSALGKFLSTFFDRFDNPNWARPLYSVARANMGGGDLISYRTPYEVRYQVSKKSISKKSKTYSDFREELKDLENIEMDIILQSYNGKTTVAERIGSLKLGKFVVSDYCDLTLHFHHSAIEDQWEKYDDYKVVEDLADQQ
jgi:hypothetical protein